MEVQTIQPGRLEELLSRGEPVEVIDVRTPAEFREVHLAQAKNIPLDRLDPRELMKSRNGRRDAPLYFLCRTGNRAQIACKKFLAAGFETVAIVEGGMAACEEAGLPVLRGKKTISLERQVRIAAGGLVVLGAVLSATVHPAWALLSAFVGAGLVFAGVTDTCGMAMLLAKMPWNQVSDKENGCSAPEKCADESEAESLQQETEPCRN